jgi:VIT1/CCC1 family predicted Fe2+/Mn2+ transporter
MRVDISEGQAEAQVPADGEHDDVTGEAEAGKADRGGGAWRVVRRLIPAVSLLRRVAGDATVPLGLQPGGLARPLQAAVVSAVSFAVGAALPLVLIVLAPIGVRVPVTAVAALGLLALLGVIGARLGGAPAGRRCG